MTLTEQWIQRPLVSRFSETRLCVFGQIMSPFVRPLYTEQKGYIKCINTSTIWIGSEHTILLRDRRQNPPSTERKIGQPDNLIPKCFIHFKVSQFVQHAPRMSYLVCRMDIRVGSATSLTSIAASLPSSPTTPQQKEGGGGRHGEYNAPFHRRTHFSPR